MICLLPIFEWIINEVGFNLYYNLTYGKAEFTIDELCSTIPEDPFLVITGQVVPVVLGYQHPTEFPCVTVVLSERGKSAMFWRDGTRGVDITRDLAEFPEPGSWVVVWGELADLDVPVEVEAVES
jgi:hypothetical protein